MAKQLTKAKLEKIIANPVMPEFAKKDAQAKLDKNDYSDYKKPSPKKTVRQKVLDSAKSDYQKEVARQKKTGDYKEGAGISLLSMSENLKKKPKASPKDSVFKSSREAGKEYKDKTKKVSVFDVMTKNGLKNKELVKEYQKVVKEVNDNPDYKDWTFEQKKSVISSVMTMDKKPSPKFVNLKSKESEFKKFIKQINDGIYGFEPTQDITYFGLDEYDGGTQYVVLLNSKDLSNLEDVTEDWLKNNAISKPYEIYEEETGSDLSGNAKDVNYGTNGITVLIEQRDEEIRSDKTTKPKASPKKASPKFKKGDFVKYPKAKLIAEVIQVDNESIPEPSIKFKYEDGKTVSDGQSSLNFAKYYDLPMYNLISSKERKDGFKSMNIKELTFYIEAGKAIIKQSGKEKTYRLEENLKLAKEQLAEKVGSPKSVMNVVKDESDVIKKCKKALTDAQYTITKKTTPSGKKQVKVKRAEKQIIKTKVDSVAATVRKDVNDKKGNKTEILASIKKIQNGLTKILQRLDLMAKNGELEKIKAIEKLLEKLN